MATRKTAASVETQLREEFQRVISSQEEMITGLRKRIEALESAKPALLKPVKGAQDHTGQRATVNMINVLVKLGDVEMTDEEGKPLAIFDAAERAGYLDWNVVDARIKEWRAVFGGNQPGITCGNCSQKHASVDEVRACYGIAS